MPKSTSLININADKGLNKWQMKAYKLANILNNSLPNIFIDKKLIIKKFKINDLDKYWPLINPQSSPSRALSDLFWITLPWLDIKQELKDLNILDIGCGSGGYLERFISWSQNSINSYTGFDIKTHPNWENLSQKYKFANFKTSDSKNILDIIPSQTNLILSQSAIEHFTEDLTFFNQIKEFINHKKEPIIQIHLFPSSACLKLYKYHGLRQYTPRTISKITKIFNQFSKSTLYNLGGENCNNIHNKFITEPKYKYNLPDKRKESPDVYFKELKESIMKDLNKNIINPSFYVLYIYSHLN